MDDLLLFHQDKVYLKLANYTDSTLPGVIGMDAITRQVRVYAPTRDKIPRLEMRLRHAQPQNDPRNEEKLIVQGKADDESGNKGRANELQEAWRSHRLPQFPEIADPKGLALFTHIAFGVDSRGQLNRVEWVCYAGQGDRVGASFLVEDHLLQHSVSVSSKRTASYVNCRCVGARLGCET
jgi:hypothetical protein